MLNTSILMGRLTSDPELKYTSNNVPVTNFTLAVDRQYKSGEEKQTDFINIVAWRNTAEFVTKYFSKGLLVALEGSIQTRRYTDKEGNNRTAFEVVANNVHFAESKKDNAAAPANSDNLTQFAQQVTNAGFTVDAADDEKLPF